MNIRVVFLFVLLISLCEFVNAQSSRTEKNASRVKTKREKVSSKKETVELKAGMKSPNFKYRDVNGKWVSLKDFRGKYVYIDFWSMGCGPCMAEVEYLKQLTKNFEGKNIVFVGISSDKDWDKWKVFVKEHELPGVQLNRENDRSFAKAYRVSWIPRFLLIDKKGRIVNPDMFWPSSGMLEKNLLELKGI